MLTNTKKLLMLTVKSLALYMWSLRDLIKILEKN